MQYVEMTGVFVGGLFPCTAVGQSLFREARRATTRLVELAASAGDRRDGDLSGAVSGARAALQRLLDVMEVPGRHGCLKQDIDIDSEPYKSIRRAFKDKRLWSSLVHLSRRRRWRRPRIPPGNRHCTKSVATLQAQSRCFPTPAGGGL
jgi:hypothetical protein